jgi:hypothetical protein
MPNVPACDAGHPPPPPWHTDRIPSPFCLLCSLAGLQLAAMTMSRKVAISRDPASRSARRLVSSSRHPNPNLRTSFHSPLTFFPSLKLAKPPSPNLLDEPNVINSEPNIQT